MRAETSSLCLSLSLSLCGGLSLAPRQLLPWETGCQQAWPWPYHPLYGVCLVIGGIAPTASLGIDLQVNSFLCEMLFAHIALPGAGCGYSSGKLEPRTMGFSNHSGENTAPGEQGSQAQREGFCCRAEQGRPVASREGCCLTLR